MYHPSRGGVRGGADQFDWENVKTDKHRENYLGHSLKAPVGRWQKGKDLLWYSKDRSCNKEEAEKAHILEMASIKKAEEEAMLVALGHKVVKKEVQPLTKEEMTEVFKRNNGERDYLNVERVEGVGISGSRTSVPASCVKQSEENPQESSPHESSAKKYSHKAQDARDRDSSHKSSRKSSKHHHKKEKKHKKMNKSEKRLSDINNDSGDGKHSKRYGYKHVHECSGKRKNYEDYELHSKHYLSEDKSGEYKCKRRCDSSSDSDNSVNINSYHKSHKTIHSNRNHENIPKDNKICNSGMKKKRHDSDSD